MLDNIALLLLLSPTLQFRFFVHAFDWYGYPTCAQPELQLAAPPYCDTGDALTTNECLCFDTTYLTTAAQNIGSACGCSVLTTSAGISEAYCLDSVEGTSLNAEQFIAAGGVCDSPSSSASAQPTTISAPSPNTSLSSPSSTFVTSTLVTSTTSTSGPSPLPASTSVTSSAYDKNDSPKADAIALGIGIPTLFFTILGVCVCRKKIAAWL
jgi:hypothetical protein